MNEHELREKVINGLERCIEKLDTVLNKTHGFNCTACPYFRKCDSSGYLIGLPLMRDAITLLKAQDKELQYRAPKKVEHKATLYKCCTCPSCGNVVGSFEQWGDQLVRITVEFCEFCGQRLDWSDECGTAVKWE